MLRREPLPDDLVRGSDGLPRRGLAGPIYIPKTWQCDLHGLGVIPAWVYRDSELEPKEGR
jgi:hypothetical protein